MYYLSLLGTVLSNRKEPMELRQSVASVKLHGLFGSRDDSFLFPENKQLAHCKRSLVGEQTEEEEETERQQPMPPACTYRLSTA